MPLTDNRYATHAVGTASAVRSEGENNTVSDPDVLNSAADRLDDPGSFMTEDGWKRRLPLPL